MVQVCIVVSVRVHTIMFVLHLFIYQLLNKVLCFAGHFVSNIRDPCGPEWLKCDDESVKSVTWSQTSKTIENHGYMFFYFLFHFS